MKTNKPHAQSLIPLQLKEARLNPLSVAADSSFSPPHPWPHSHSMAVSFLQTWLTILYMAGTTSQPSSHHFWFPLCALTLFPIRLRMPELWAVAQTVSYEVTIAIILLSVLLINGSFSIQSLIYTLFFPCQRPSRSLLTQRLSTASFIHTLSLSSLSQCTPGSLQEHILLWFLHC